MHLSRRLMSRVRTVPRVIIRSQRETDSGFDRFTGRARTVLTLAQDEAKRLGHNYIGTEHLLLGLIRERRGVAGRMLHDMGVHLPATRSAVEAVVGRGSVTSVGEMHLTCRAKRALEQATKEASELRHDFVGTEHLLLGMLREGEGVAAQMLRPMGITLAKVRREVVRVIGHGPGRAH